MLRFPLLLITLLLVGMPAHAGDDVESIGSALRLGLPAAALVAAWDDPQGKRQLIYSLGATAGATYMLKYAIDAEGPDGDEHAFPSGHASVAFASAAFLQRRYGWSFGAPAYILAGFVGWSRIDADEHTEGQVLAGAALGIAASHWLTDPERRLQVALGPTGMSVGCRQCW